MRGTTASVPRFVRFVKRRDWSLTEQKENSRRYTDTFVDNWLFEHEFELSDVKLLEGETCDAMLADKDTILELVKNEHFIPAEWIYDFFTFAEI